jgi:RNA polymerase primary sigma factor
VVRVFDRYLRDIGRHPLLTREEELELARRSRCGDEQARRRLITANLRFVVSVARDYRGRGLPMADLVNEGNLGLLRASERFDESRGVRFVSYAHWWVRRSILHAIERQGGRARTGRAGPPWVSIDEPIVGAVTLQDVLPDSREPGPDERLRLDRLKGAVRASLTDLPEREREVVSRHFGVGSGGDESLAQIARSLGVTRERVRQLRDQGLQRLRTHAGRHALDSLRPGSAGRAATHESLADRRLPVD